ncbi:hypothetical protein CPC08DRAFT_715973 [Agrocybe pediades]|nr:hypothetical protein CPC08DRAFT_715973 [Agrocybe pediades]
MRYQSRSPLTSRSLNLPLGLAAVQQRANATCSLSLTSVSVGSSRVDGGISTMDMDLGGTPTVLVPVPQPDKIAKASVAFPKRPHSLLRGTTPSTQDTGCARGGGEGDAASAQDVQEDDTCLPPQDSGAPPRKRTRTMAILNGRKARSPRPTSSHAAAQRVPTPPLVTSLASSTSPEEADMSPSIDSSTDSTMTFAPPSPPSPPTRRLFWFRRRFNVADMRVILFLYRTLVYGLEVRYADSRGTDDLTLDSEAISIKARSCFDVQDACLAQNLKGYLLRRLTDPKLLVVDVEAISREGRADLFNPDSMDVDVSSTSSLSTNSNSSVTSPSSHGIDSSLILHPHLHASTQHSVLSYQQLVAHMHLRRHLPGKNLTRSSPKLKKPSPLANSDSLDFC